MVINPALKTINQHTLTNLFKNLFIMKQYTFNLIGTNKNYTVNAHSIELAYSIVKLHLGTNKIVIV